MRLRIIVDNQAPNTLPINYQERLSNYVYELLEDSQVDFGEKLADRSIAYDESTGLFRLFTFSRLRGRYTFEHEASAITFDPGHMEWLIASPVESFITAIASAVVAAGRVLSFPLHRTEKLPTPPFTGTARCLCFSPMVALAATPAPDGTLQYLGPKDGKAFSDSIRRSTSRKFKAVTGKDPADDRLSIEFDRTYFAQHRGVTWAIANGMEVSSADAPFVLTGSPDLIRVGLDAGFGEYTWAGFGMVRIKTDSHPHSKPNVAQSGRPPRRRP
jgi:CRISPR-associated endoribonuclease Cas6